MCNEQVKPPSVVLIVETFQTCSNWIIYRPGNSNVPKQANGSVRDTAENELSNAISVCNIKEKPLHHITELLVFTFLFMYSGKKK